MLLDLEQRETLNRWLPTLLAAAAIWLLARGVGKLFHFALFGVVWVYVGTQGFSHFLH